MAEGSSDRSLRERLEDGQLIQQALRRGVREALWRHKMLGNPVCLWRDNQVAWIAPEDIDVEPDH